MHIWALESQPTNKKVQQKSFTLFWSQFENDQCFPYFASKEEKNLVFLFFFCSCLCTLLSSEKKKKTLVSIAKNVRVLPGAKLIRGVTANCRDKISKSFGTIHCEALIEKLQPFGFITTCKRKKKAQNSISTSLVCHWMSILRTKPHLHANANNWFQPWINNPFLISFHILIHSLKSLSKRLTYIGKNKSQLFLIDSTKSFSRKLFFAN